jgi:hypothetical protein
MRTAVRETLPADRMLLVTEDCEGAYAADRQQLVVNISPESVCTRA